VKYFSENVVGGFHESRKEIEQFTR